LAPPSRGWAWGAKGAQPEGGVINRFSTYPPPQEPASSMLPLSLSFLLVNALLCARTRATRATATSLRADPDCEAQGRTTARREGRAPPSETGCLPFFVHLGAATCAMLCLCWAHAIHQASVFFPLRFREACDSETQRPSIGKHPSLQSQSDLLARHTNTYFLLLFSSWFLCFA
jgi:hypothetical protein